MDFNGFDENAPDDILLATSGCCWRARSTCEDDYSLGFVSGFFLYLENRSFFNSNPVVSHAHLLDMLYEPSW